MHNAKALYDKYFPDSFTLETSRVELRLMKPGDLEAFLPLTKDKDIWTWFQKDLSDEKELSEWIDDAMYSRQEKMRMPFTIMEKEQKVVCGSTSYGNISFYDKRLEIGWTWLGTAFMGTGINRHTKFALLSHAFEALGMERVEAKTDFLNERSKSALLGIGMQPEGILRNHMQMFNHRRRDSIYFSILKEEWPAVKQHYFGKLI